LSKLHRQYFKIAFQTDNIFNHQRGSAMRITTTDPISGKDVNELENAPFVIEGSGEDALKIYFESQEHKANYLDIESKTPQKVLLDVYNQTTGFAREM
jgi:YHS domain-containing protein